MNKLIIEKELLKHNVQVIKNHAGTTPVMGIVKCNGYETYLLSISAKSIESLS